MKIFIKLLCIIVLPPLLSDGFTAEHHIYADPLLEHFLVAKNEVTVLLALTPDGALKVGVEQLIAEGQAEPTPKKGNLLRGFVKTNFSHLPDQELENSKTYLYCRIIQKWGEDFVEEFLNYERLNKFFLRSICYEASSTCPEVGKRKSSIVYYALKTQNEELISLAVATFPSSVLDDTSIPFVTTPLLQSWHENGLLSLINRQRHKDGRNLSYLLAHQFFIKGEKPRIVFFHPLSIIASFYPEEIFKDDSMGFCALSWLSPSYISAFSQYTNFKLLFEEHQRAKAASGEFSSDKNTPEGSFE